MLKLYNIIRIKIRILIKEYYYKNKKNYKKKIKIKYIKKI